jgi:hypothetical protein
MAPPGTPGHGATASDPPKGKIATTIAAKVARVNGP